jgi:hypothetical protein
MYQLVNVIFLSNKSVWKSFERVSRCFLFFILTGMRVGPPGTAASTGLELLLAYTDTLTGRHEEANGEIF